MFKTQSYYGIQMYHPHQFFIFSNVLCLVIFKEGLQCIVRMYIRIKKNVIGFIFFLQALFLLTLLTHATNIFFL